jgi:hypothetical protein
VYSRQAVSSLSQSCWARRRDCSFRERKRPLPDTIDAARWRRPYSPQNLASWSSAEGFLFSYFHEDSTTEPWASSRKRTAAISGVMSRCGVPSISNPTMNLRIVAERSKGG